MKGTYKAKLSLEKLIVEHERKKIHVATLLKKQDSLMAQLEVLRDQAGQKFADGTENVSAIPENS